MYFSTRNFMANIHTNTVNAYANRRRLFLYLFSPILVHACSSGLDIGFAYTQQAQDVVLTSIRREAHDVNTTSFRRHAPAGYLSSGNTYRQSICPVDLCVYIQVCTDFYTCMSSRNLFLSPPFLWNGQI